MVLPGEVTNGVRGTAGSSQYTVVHCHYWQGPSDGGDGLCRHSGRRSEESSDSLRLSYLMGDSRAIFILKELAVTKCHSCPNTHLSLMTLTPSW